MVLIGENATVDEMVDFIVAAQIAEKFRKDTTDRTNNSEANIEVKVLCKIKCPVYLLRYIQHRLRCLTAQGFEKKKWLFNMIIDFGSRVRILTHFCENF